MHRRLLINLVLGAAILLLAALALYEPRIEDSATPRPLTSLDPGQIQHVRIIDNRGKEVELSRRATGWMMLAPYRIAADGPRVQALLRIAAAPVHTRFPAQPERLEAFGLAPAAVGLQLDGHSLLIGSTDPLRFRRYIMTGDTINLIDDGFYHHMAAPAEDFISRNLFPPDAHIESVRLPEYRIDRQPDGSWRVSPADQPVAQDRLAQRMAAWTDAQAVVVRAAPGPESGRPLEFVLRGRNQPLRFLIPEESPNLLWRSDLQLTYRLANAAELLARP